MLAARITGLLILAFTAVAVLDNLALLTVEAAYDGDIEFLSLLSASKILDALRPAFRATWLLSILAWGTGLYLVARERGPTRIVAGVGVVAAAAGAVVLSRFLAPVRLIDAAAVARLDTWSEVAAGCDVLVRLAAIATVMLLAGDRARSGVIRSLAAVGLVAPLLIALRAAEVEFVVAMFEGSMSWGRTLAIISDAALGIAFVGVSVGLDEPTVDRASARSLELARTLVWVRAGLVVASVLASSAAFRAIQRAQSARAFGDAPDSDHTGILTLAAGLGHLEAALGVAFALAIMLIGLRYRARERVLGAVGGFIMLYTARIGAGLAVAQHEALFATPGLFDSPVLDHARRAQDIDPYLRGFGVVAMLLWVIAAIQVADGVRGEPRVRGARFIAVVVIVSLFSIFARDALAELGMGIWIVAIFALGAGILALLDLTAVLKMAAKGLRGETTVAESEADLDGWTL